MSIKLEDSKGFTLIEIMIAVAVSSLVIAAITSVYLNFSAAHSSAERQRDLLDIQSIIMRQIGCKETLGASSEKCMNLEIALMAKPVKGNPSKVIIPATGKVFGTGNRAFTVRAFCDRAKGIKVLAGRLKPGQTLSVTTPANAFYPDPLTKKIPTYKDGGVTRFGVKLMAEEASPCPLTTLPTSPSSGGTVDISQGFRACVYITGDDSRRTCTQCSVYGGGWGELPYNDNDIERISLWMEKCP